VWPKEFGASGQEMSQAPQTERINYEDKYTDSLDCRSIVARLDRLSPGSG
jgi:hypothetical protein